MVTLVNLDLELLLLYTLVWLVRLISVGLHWLIPIWTITTLLRVVVHLCIET